MGTVLGVLGPRVGIVGLVAYWCLSGSAVLGRGIAGTVLGHGVAVLGSSAGAGGTWRIGAVLLTRHSGPGLLGNRVLGWHHGKLGPAVCMVALVLACFIRPNWGLGPS
jgi:hypothetical protein